ncbi:hypothetical protein DAETH_48630 (plasmid) [Deinococcus aetherius]|uniref:Uncharacterized protein n=1 Tax=Deinococcus aetherius TaxID=200252 RepID=A0ABN6RS36_9DEIO|nr:hypothetical protein [Deinococcus aetherius]BDP44894.1 hypothetical protein DAETH_48630 [Deinococcus aetherius]
MSVSRTLAELPLPDPYPVGTRVTWREGERVRTGLVDVVHLSTGWPAEYGVLPLRQDGTRGSTLRHLHHSQLNPPAPGETDVLSPAEVRRRLGEIQGQLRRRP